MNRTFGRVPNSSSKKNLIFVLGGMTVVVLLVVAALIMFQGSKPAVKQPLVVQTETTEPSVKMVDVLIPIQTIEAGTALEPAMFKREVRPQINVSARVAREIEDIQGQYAKSMIIAGQPLHRDFLTSVRPVSSLSPRIPDGFRAIAISVNATSIVEGWAQPGSKVDVSWASSINGKPGLSIIVQNAKVLSAQKNQQANSEPGAPIPTTVTLLVSAADAQKIQLAQSAGGSLSLQLRGDPDTGKINVGKNSITVEDLLNSGKLDPDIDCIGEVIVSGVKKCLTSGGTLKDKVGAE